ncbi:MAG: TonB-dependent receptor [Paludibacteraceae bacterium]|nr:TonB-dependent receptor [Paludibacteraceae bacterium]
MSPKIYILLFLLISPLTLWSAEIDTTKVYELQEVCFSPKRIRRDIVPFQRMDSTVIENLGCQSVADAIRFFSGVQIKDYGGVGGIKTINVRSMGTNQMGVFYDGIQLGNAQNGQVDLGRFSLDNIEAIDLYNGQKGDGLQCAKDYGAAGTIYITTKKPSFSNGKDYTVDVKMKAGSFGLANPSITYSQKLGKSVILTLSAEYTYSNGKYKFRYKKTAPDGTTLYDTTAIRQNADIQAVRTEAALFGSVKNGEWNAKVYNYYSDRGLPGYIARNVFSHSQRQWDDNFFAQASYKQTYIDGKLSFQAKAKYAYDYTRYLDPDSTHFQVDNSYRQQEAYLSGALNYKIFSWWDISLATDFQYNYLDSDIKNFAYPSRYTELVALATTFRHPNVKFQASVLGNFVQDNVKNGATSKPYNVFTPTALLTVRPVAKVAFDIRAFYKRAFRMPTFNDLYYATVGSTSLRPEYVDQYDVGLSYQYSKPADIFNNFAVQIDGYHNRVKDKIVAIPAANPFRWQMKNYGNVSVTGVDVSVDMGLQWCRYWNLGLRLAYSYQVAADQSFDKSSPYYGGQLPYSPWHSGSAILNIAWKNLELTYSFIYTGERYTSSANIPVNYVEPWQTNDVAVSYTHPFKAWKLRTSVQVNNIANQQYEVVRGYPMPGTNFRVIVGATF